MLRLSIRRRSSRPSWSQERGQVRTALYQLNAKQVQATILKKKKIKYKQMILLLILEKMHRMKLTEGLVNRI